MWPGVGIASSVHPGPSMRPPSHSGDVRLEAVVAGFQRNLVLDRGPLHRAAVNRRPGPLRQRARERRMIEVVVGDRDGDDPLASRGGEDRFEMLGQVGAGIDHRHLARGQRCRSPCPERERAGIVRRHPPDERRELVAAAVLDVDVADERNHFRRPPGSRRDRSPRTGPGAPGPRPNGRRPEPRPAPRC